VTDDPEREDDVKTRAELIDELVSLRQKISDEPAAKPSEHDLDRYRSMVTASHDLMVFVDPTYTYRAVNPAYCAEHMRTEDEIIGHSVVEVFGEALFEGTLKPRMDRCLSGEAVAFAFWWNSPSRGRRHVDVRYDPFFEDDGSVSGILVDVRDTTEQTLTKEELERSVVALEVANRDLEAFGDSLAHDLKTPLLTVTNFSYYLNESIGNSLDEQQADHLQRIQGAGQQMIQIIYDLRDLADVDRVEIRPDEVDLTSLAQGVIGDMRALAPDRKVGLEAEPDIMALGDGTLLRLLLTNLFQNAWKYTGKSDDAHIELGVVEDEGGVPVYYVRDNGIGFDNVHREKIFRAFERLDTVGDISGSGLGLATVERIVHRHGGRAWAEGTPGEGAVFYFTLASSSSDMASLILDRRSQVR